jgi:OOP family OmpA-OmpF porin
VSAPSTGTIGRTTRNRGLFADLVGTLPIGNQGFSAIGRIGAIYSHTRASYAIAGGVGLAPGVESRPLEREVNWKYGAGAEYELTKTIAARAEWERYPKLGKDSTTGEYNVDLFSLNVRIRF